MPWRATLRTAGSPSRWSEPWDRMSWTSRGPRTAPRVRHRRGQAEALGRCPALPSAPIALAPAVAAGSIENETVILDSSPGSHVLARYRDHRHFVQGVAWDPWGVMLATAGGDRTVRVYSLKQAAGGKKAAEKRTSAQRARNFALRHTLRSRASQAAAEGASGSAAPTNQVLGRCQRSSPPLRRSGLPLSTPCRVPLPCRLLPMPPHASCPCGRTTHPAPSSAACPGLRTVPSSSPRPASSRTDPTRPRATPASSSPGGTPPARPWCCPGSARPPWPHAFVPKPSGCR